MLHRNKSVRPEKGQISRRFLLQLSAMAALSPLLNACVSNVRPFILGYNNFVPYRLFDLAQSIGLLKPEKVHLLELESASHAAQSLASGVIDAALLTLDEVLRLWHRGYEIDVVAVIDISNGIDQVVARPPIRDTNDIRGKKIAVEVGAVGSIMLSKLLERAKLSASDVNVVYGMLSDHVNLYQSGAVDLVISFAPESEKIKKLGAQLIFSSADFSPLIIDLLVVDRKRARQDPETLRTIIDAYFGTLARWQTQPSTLIAQLSAISQLTSAELGDVMAGVQMIDRDHNRHLLSGDKAELVNAAKNLAPLLNLPEVDIAHYLLGDYLS